MCRWGSSPPVPARPLAMSSLAFSQGERDPASQRAWPWPRSRGLSLRTVPQGILGTSAQEMWACGTNSRLHFCFLRTAGPNHAMKLGALFLHIRDAKCPQWFHLCGFYKVLVSFLNMINCAVISGAIPYSTKHADSIDLELEVDPLNVDHFSCTPLVRNRFICS